MVSGDWPGGLPQGDVGGIECITIDDQRWLRRVGRWAGLGLGRVRTRRRGFGGAKIGASTTRSARVAHFSGSGAVAVAEPSGWHCVCSAVETRAHQALIAAISGLMPRMFMTRVRL